MKLLDANILVHAYDADSTHHVACRPWLDTTFNSDEIVGLPWQTILAFVRISTNARACKRPLPISDACNIVTLWLARPNIAVIEAGDRFWRIFQDQVNDAQVSGPMITEPEWLPRRR